MKNTSAPFRISLPLYPLLLFFAVPSAAQVYCKPNVQMACFYGDKITRVVFAGIDHTDDVCTTDDHGMKDFTTSVPAGQVRTGETYTLSVGVENSLSSGTERVRAWIDYNRNGVFEASESVNLGTGTGNTTLQVSVTIPADAQPGTTRMRVMYRRTQTNPLNAEDACHSYGSYRGQAKDYALAVVYPAPLPVELNYFTAVPAPTGIDLDWETLSETNNDRFTVERSADAWNWQPVGTVPGAGNSNTALRYRYADTAPYDGINYYRLTQIDFDGHATHYTAQGTVYHAPAGTRPYPNPCRDFLTVPHDGTPMHAALYDPNGKPVDIPQPGHTAMDMRSLPAGTYLLVLSDGHTCRRHIIVKQ